ncbi:putative acid-sensing ion channel 1-like [Apostichopus japonicus]|uniref:Putative acid-sensing ion channel 1-like n=1 Tax=Stichopus japonicus TaxID=307972 RepID=A0A2G8LGG8_STIJA|nr:putative acid-sensing ion channel 1-like [Apostichopus japonicus]
MNDRGPQRNEVTKSRASRFAEETTLHGVRYVANGRIHHARRICWLILLVCLAVWLAYGIVNGLTKYFSYPISTAVMFNYVNNLEFPAVTICNYNQFRKSQLQNYTLLREVLTSLSTSDSVDIDWDLHDMDDYLNMTEVAIKLAHQLDDMLIECTWNQEETCGAHNFTTVITDFGVCYTFNSISNSELMVTEAGSSQGLRLRLSAEQYDYFWGYYTGAGFKIFVHPKGQFPLVGQFGISASPGFKTSVRISYITKRIVFYVCALYYTYNSTNCPIRLVLIVSAIRNSNTQSIILLKPAFMNAKLTVSQSMWMSILSFPGTEELCNLREILECVFPAINNITDLCSSVECSLPCKEEAYEMKISFTLWPSDFEATYIANNLNKTTDFLRSNLLELNLFFDILGIEELSQTPSYDYFALQSDIGAYMGLFGGASIVTIFEFIDCILATVSRRRRKAIVQENVGDVIKPHGKHQVSSNRTDENIAMDDK